MLPDPRPPTWIELTAFQRDCLEAVARRERTGRPCDERGITHTLERRYPSVTRTRLEPNLRTLVGRGLLANRAGADDRPTYALTDEGRALLIQRAERFAVTCGISATDRNAGAGATSSGLRRRTLETRDEKPKRCPDCGATVPERDPLVGWWCCDDCGILLDDDGERLT